MKLFSNCEKKAILLLTLFMVVDIFLDLTDMAIKYCLAVVSEKLFKMDKTIYQKQDVR